MFINIARPFRIPLSRSVTRHQVYPATLPPINYFNADYGRVQHFYGVTILIILSCILFITLTHLFNCIFIYSSAYQPPEFRAYSNS